MDVCIRCGGSGLETEQYQKPMGGASREMVNATRQITCQVCGGSGKTGVSSSGSGSKGNTGCAWLVVAIPVLGLVATGLAAF